MRYAVAAIVVIVGISLLLSFGALAREFHPGRAMAALDDGRFLLARDTDEGVILRFCGHEASVDDPIFFLRDYAYVANVMWLAETRTAVVAVGKSEGYPELFGFSPDGQRLWQHKSEWALRGARFVPLPGDSTLGYVPASAAWGPPRPISFSQNLYFPRRPGRTVYRRDLVGEGTNVIEWRFNGGEIEVTCRDILVPKAHWSTSLSGFLVDCRVRKDGGGVGRHCAWLSWQCDFEPFPVVAIDLGTGAELGRRNFDGYGASFLPEPGGNRLALWFEDFEHRGRMEILDGVTLSPLDTLVVPNEWYPLGSNYGDRLDFSTNMTLGKIRGCQSPKSAQTPVGRPNLEPRSLVVVWGDSVTTHFLPVVACMDSSGEVWVWYEWFSDGSWRHIEVLNWRPPKSKWEEDQWTQRWDRIRR